LTHGKDPKTTTIQTFIKPDTYLTSVWYKCDDNNTLAMALRLLVPAIGTEVLFLISTSGNFNGIRLKWVY